MPGQRLSKEPWVRCGRLDKTNQGSKHVKAIDFGAVVGLLLLSLVFKSLPGREYTLGKVEFQFLGFADVVQSMQSFFTSSSWKAR